MIDTVFSFIVYILQIIFFVVAVGIFPAFIIFCLIAIFKKPKPKPKVNVTRNENRITFTFKS